MPRTRIHNVSAAQWSANGLALGSRDLTQASNEVFGANVFSLAEQRKRLPKHVYDQLREELDQQAAALQSRVAEMYSKDPHRAESELQTARMRLAAAEKSSIEAAVRSGFISTQAAAKLLDRADQRAITAGTKR